MFPHENLQDIHEISKVCAKFKEDYLKGKMSAGDYLLAHIKRASGAHFEIPDKALFDRQTVKNILSDYINRCGLAYFKRVVNFIEILYYPHENVLLYEDLLDWDVTQKFKDFTIQFLKISPFHQWPNKGAIIVRAFITMSEDEQLKAAHSLSFSEDYDTARIGWNLEQGLRADSYTGLIPYYNQLLKCCPTFKPHEATQIFGRLFINFQQIKPSNDPSFIML